MKYVGTCPNNAEAGSEEEEGSETVGEKRKVKHIR